MESLEHFSTCWQAQLAHHPEVVHSQYLVVDSKAVYQYREVVHSQYLMVDSKAVYLYREVDYSQYLVVDSKAVYHNTRRWHHPEVETPHQH